MRAIAIASREAGAMLRTPTGWVVAALFVTLTGALFATQTLEPGRPATLRYFFGPAAWLLLLVAPAVSMRLLSEEFRSGTVETLRAAPVGDATVVAGKLLGGLAFVALMLAPTLVFPAALLAASQPAPGLGPIVAGYAGLLCAGAVYLAAGLLVGSLTDSQTLAYVGTLMLLLAVSLVSGPLASRLPPGVAEIAATLSVQSRVARLAKGVVELGDVAFFAAAAAVLAGMAWASLSTRRCA